MATYKSLAALHRKLDRFTKDMPETARALLIQAGYMVRREVVNEHLSGPKMPRGVGSESKGTLQPHTGYLRRSVRVRTEKRGTRLLVYIGSDAVYARIHEEGGKFMPKRPFLAPSVKKQQKAVVEMLLKGIVDNYRGRA